MKKKNLTNLKLNKKSISSLSAESTYGGGRTKVSICVKCPYGPTDATLDFDCPSFWC